MTSLSGGYFPQYPPRDDLPDPEIRTFLTNFYRISDNPTSNELWVSCFTNDAHLVMGGDVARGAQEIRELRESMWEQSATRKHTVTKVFPARFSDPSDKEHESECEVMMHGTVELEDDWGNPFTASWAGHGVLRKDTEGEREEWKFKTYSVWIQRERL